MEAQLKYLIASYVFWRYILERTSRLSRVYQLVIVSHLYRYIVFPRKVISCDPIVINTIVQHSDLNVTALKIEENDVNALIRD